MPDPQRPNLDKLLHDHERSKETGNWHGVAEDALEALPSLVATAHRVEAMDAAMAGAQGQLHWINEADVSPTVWSYVQAARAYLVAGREGDAT